MIRACLERRNVTVGCVYTLGERDLQQIERVVSRGLGTKNNHERNYGAEGGNASIKVSRRPSAKEKKAEKKTPEPSRKTGKWFFFWGGRVTNGASRNARGPKGFPIVRRKKLKKVREQKC